MESLEHNGHPKTVPEKGGPINNKPTHRKLRPCRAKLLAAKMNDQKLASFKAVPSLRRVL